MKVVTLWQWGKGSSTADNHMPNKRKLCLNLNKSVKPSRNQKPVSLSKLFQ